MFTSDFKESKDKEVILNEVDPTALEILINFAYTAEAEITSVNVESLLMASEFLQVLPVRDSCCVFLCKNLDCTNVLKIQVLANSLNLSKLVEDTNCYIKQNFDTFCQTEEFLNLSFSVLNDVIRTDDLKVTSEENVFDAVMKWVKNDTTRHSALPELLTGVRMTYLTPHFLVNKASKEKLILESFRCRDLLDEAKHIHLLPEMMASCCTFNMSERSSQRDVCGIYIFCYSYSLDQFSILKYIPETRKCIILQKFKGSYYPEYVFSVGERIYVFRKKNPEVFLPRTLQWFPGPKFPDSRSGLGKVVQCNSRIYWLKNHSAYCKEFYFDTEKKEWFSHNDEIVTLNCNDELVPCGNKIYIFRDKGYSSSNRVDAVYNPCTRTCSEMSCSDMRYTKFGSAVLNGQIYICGGTPIEKKSELLSSCQYCELQPSCYDFDKLCYIDLRSLRPMNIPRKKFSLVPYRGMLYAIGGTTAGGDNSAIERYDPQSDAWTLAGNLGAPYSFAKAVAISITNDTKGS